MNGFLLDTHIFLWSLNDPTQLSHDVLAILEDVETTVYVSAVTTWEIITKRAKGKLEFEDDIVQKLHEQSFRPLSITHEHVKGLEKLSPIHKDPFDRILIAQAIAEDLTLITRDKKILQYPDIKILKA